MAIWAWSCVVNIVGEIETTIDDGWCYFARVNRTNWNPSSIFMKFLSIIIKVFNIFYYWNNTDLAHKTRGRKPLKTRSEDVRKGKRFRFMCALQARKAFDWKFNDERNWNAKRRESWMSLQDRRTGNFREAENISSSIRTALVAKVFPFLSTVSFESFWRHENCVKITSKPRP